MTIYIYIPNPTQYLLLNIISNKLGMYWDKSHNGFNSKNWTFSNVKTFLFDKFLEIVH